MLSLSILGVSINGYAKNIAQDVAIDAARYSALADQDLVAGQNRALSALRAELGGIFKATVTARTDSADGVCANSIQVSLKPMRLGLLGSSLTIKETGTAICELQG